jgi:hypothetical protein
VEIDHTVRSTPHHNLLESMPKQNQVWQLSLIQKKMKWLESTLCNLKLKKSILYLILSIGMSLYQEGYHMDCQQSLNAQHSLKPK